MKAAYVLYLSRADPMGGKWGNCPPPWPTKKNERGERGRKKERKKEKWSV